MDRNCDMTEMTPPELSLRFVSSEAKTLIYASLLYYFSRPLLDGNCASIHQGRCINR